MFPNKYAQVGTAKIGTGMTEIMPVPRNLHITVLQPPSIMRVVFIIFAIKLWDRP